MGQRKKSLTRVEPMTFCKPVRCSNHLTTLIELHETRGWTELFETVVFPRAHTQKDLLKLSPPPPTPFNVALEGLLRDQGRFLSM